MCLYKMTNRRNSFDRRQHIPKMSKFLIPVVVWCILTQHGYAKFPSEDQLADLFKGYNSNIPPTFNGTAVHDNLQMYILSIDSISDSSMDYSMSFYFRQTWTDSRLQYNFTNVDVLEIDTKMIGDLWLPDVYIINEKRANFHDITVPNKLINIYPDGRVFYSARITGTFTCSMDLHKYPLDRQICDIRFESYSFSAKTIVIRWQPEASILKDGLQLPQFNLTKRTAFTCDGIYYGVNYTCVGMKFYLERNRGYYITQIYVPSILVIILSWVNFWLSVEAVPARISLGLLTVLTMSTQSASALSNLQKVSYVKALDIWLAVCLTFVFGALIEFAYVNVTARVEQRRRMAYTVMSKFMENKRKNKEEENGGPGEEKGKKNNNKKKKEKSRQIDRISRIVFPVVFLIFNIVYWTFYLVWEPVEG